METVYPHAFVYVTPELSSRNCQVSGQPLVQGTPCLMLKYANRDEYTYVHPEQLPLTQSDVTTLSGFSELSVDEQANLLRISAERYTEVAAAEVVEVVDAQRVIDV